MALEGYKSNHNVVYLASTIASGRRKYRRAVLVGRIAKGCEQVLRKVATKYRAEILFGTLRSRLPTLWTNRYFLSTVGGVPLAVIQHYVESQKNV